MLPGQYALIRRGTSAPIPGQSDKLGVPDRSPPVPHRDTSGTDAKYSGTSESADARPKPRGNDGTGRVEDRSNGHLAGSDSMETLLSLENVNQDMGRKRPTTEPCHRARGSDWSVRERSRVMGVTARMPRGVASGKARIGESLLHVLASRVTRSSTPVMTATV